MFLGILAWVSRNSPQLFMFVVFGRSALPCPGPNNRWCFCFVLRNGRCGLVDMFLFTSHGAQAEFPPAQQFLSFRVTIVAIIVACFFCFPHCCFQLGSVAKIEVPKTVICGHMFCYDQTGLRGKTYTILKIKLVIFDWCFLSLSETRRKPSFLVVFVFF